MNAPPLGLLAALTLAIAITGLVSFEIQQEQVKHEVKQRLGRIADRKVRGFSSWLREQYDDAYAVSRNQFVGETVARWLDQGARADATGNRLEQYFSDLITAHVYDGVVLFDRHGESKLAIGPYSEVSANESKHAADAFRSDRIASARFASVEAQGQATVGLDFYLPLLAPDKDGIGPVAVLMIRINAPAFVSPLIQESAAPGASVEALLVQREGDNVVYLTALRHRKDAPLSLKLPVSRRDLPAALAVQGREGEVEGLDYRGVSVVAALRKIPDTPWHLVAKIDATEAYAPVRGLAHTIAAMAALAFFAVAAAVLLWWRAQRAQYRAQQAEAESERLALVQHFDYLVKFANDAIVLADEQGNFVETNDRALSESGYTREELLRMNARDLLAAEDLTKYEHNAGGSALAGRVFETVARRKDASTYPVEVSARTIEIEGRRFNQYIARDISERRRAENALRDNEETLRTVASSAQDAVLMLDNDGNIVLWNVAAEKMFRYSSEEALGKNLHTLLAPPRFHEAHRIGFGHFRSTGEGAAVGKTLELAALRKDGTEFPVELSLSAVKLKDKWHGVGFVRDITERKQAEHERLTHLRFFESMNRVNRAIQGANDLEQMMSDALDATFSIFDCDRAWLLYPCDPEAPSFRVSMEITKPEYPGAKVLNADVPMSPAESQTMREALQSDAPVTYTAGTERPISTAKQFGVQSQMFVPVHPKLGKPWVLGMHQCSYPRIWTVEEKSLFQEIGRRLADALTSMLMQRDLRMSEEKYRTIFEESFDGLFITSPGGKILDMNRKGVAMFGYDSKEEMRQLDLARDVYAHPPDRKRILAMVDAQGTAEYEVVVKKKSGETMVTRCALTAARDEVGAVVSYRGIISDVTEKKQAERALHSVNRALKATSDCNMAMIHATDETALLNEICRIIVDAEGYRLAWVGYVEHDAQKTIRPVAHSGYEPGYMDHTNITWADNELGRGPLGIAIRTGQIQVVQDVQTDSRFEPWRENAARLGYGSVLVAPLLSNSDTIGALSIYAEGADAFDAGEITLLGELAADMAFGIVTLRTRAAQAQSAERLQRSMEATIQVIAGTVEMRDPYTAGHQLRVAELATAIAQKMGLPDEQTHGIRLAGMVHDLGKIHIPAEILSKPGKLTRIEFELIKMHPETGYEILKDVDFPWPIAQIVYQHHERLDGSGYPRGLKAEEILLEARILSVADVVDAMSSHRPYRPAIGIEPALEEIRANAGKHYDPEAVRACITLFREKAFAFHA